MSVFGLLATLLMPAPILFFKYGGRLREKFALDLWSLSLSILWLWLRRLNCCWWWRFLPILELSIPFLNSLVMVMELLLMLPWCFLYFRAVTRANKQWWWYEAAMTIGISTHACEDPEEIARCCFGGRFENKFDIPCTRHFSTTNVCSIYVVLTKPWTNLFSNIIMTFSKWFPEGPSRIEVELTLLDKVRFHLLNMTEWQGLVLWVLTTIKTSFPGPANP